MATDNGSPALSGTNTFQVNVTEVNSAPTVVGMPDQTVAELSTLIVTNVASDVDLPANTLAFSLINPPPGVGLDPATGVLTWTPVVGQGGSNYVVRVRVSDQGVPPLFATNTMNIRVNTSGGTTQPAVLTPISADASGFRLQVAGQPRARYMIEFSTDMQQWSDRDTVTLGEGPTASSTDARAMGGTAGFYRVRSP